VRAKRVLLPNLNNALGTDGWRKTIYSHVQETGKYLNLKSAPAPQPVPAAPPSAQTTTPLPVEPRSPEPQPAPAPQPAPRPPAPNPPSASSVVAGRNSSRRGREPGSSSQPAAPRPQPQVTPAPHRQPSSSRQTSRPRASFVLTPSAPTSSIYAPELSLRRPAHLRNRPTLTPLESTLAETRGRDRNLSQGKGCGKLSTVSLALLSRLHCRRPLGHADSSVRLQCDGRRVQP
jgi:hypothetical protein